MTTSRPEIVIEGSQDGAIWKAYEFHWKPGDVQKRPPFVAPHQPRLDWQMWFAALGSMQRNPWLVNLMIRMMQGDEVAPLTKSDVICPMSRREGAGCSTAAISPGQSSAASTGSARAWSVAGCLTTSRRSASRYGKGRSRTPDTRLKTAVFA